MNFEQILPLLSRTPAALDALLRGLPDEWVMGNEGGDRSTARWPIGSRGRG
jgi:hypothetical protein